MFYTNKNVQLFNATIYLNFCSEVETKKYLRNFPPLQHFKYKILVTNKCCINKILYVSTSINKFRFAVRRSTHQKLCPTRIILSGVTVIKLWARFLYLYSITVQSEQSIYLICCSGWMFFFFRLWVQTCVQKF